MWCRSRYVLDLVIIDFLLKTVAANLSLLCARLKMWGISCCRCRSISVSQQVGVSVSFLSSPSSSLLSATFRFVKPSMPVMLEPSPGTLTSSLCISVCLACVSTLPYLLKAHESLHKLTYILDFKLWMFKNCPFLSWRPILASSFLLSHFACPPPPPPHVFHLRSC